MNAVTFRGRPRSRRAETAPERRFVKGHQHAERFFAATVIGGSLYVCGIRLWDPWKPSWLEYVSEQVADLSVRSSCRKVRTREELERAVRDAAPPQVITVWIHESLVEDARRLWRRNRWR
jgi:hypothetical protein